jgi:hypothetical protein
LTTYYSASMTQADIELVARWVAATGTSITALCYACMVQTPARSPPPPSPGIQQPYNSRVFLKAPGLFEVRLASAETSGDLPAGGPVAAAALRLGRHEFEGVVIDVVRGDYAPLMRRAAAGLRAARIHAANATQVRTSWWSVFSCSVSP